MDHGQRNDIMLCSRNIPYLAGSTPESRPRADKVINGGESPRHAVRAFWSDCLLARVVTSPFVPIGHSL